MIGGTILAIKGIDVSVWQGDIDWNAVKADGIQFAMIRCGFGMKNPTQIDDTYYKNMVTARNAGIDCGVYHYSYAVNANEAVNEAEFVLELVENYSLTYPIAFDIEEPSIQNAGKRALTDVCKAFCDRIERAGYYCAIYTNPNWLQNYLFANELLDKYDLWLAQWGVNNPSYSCGMWQYSDSGIVSGINGKVDMNYAYKDYPQVIKSAGLNGFAGNQNTAPKEENKNITYTVQTGDTLWGIAEKLLGNGTRYSEIKSLNNLTSDTIYTGQVFKIPSK
jgi:GH25 family lysozyme M1 (1,4-beta-N-acetylmuramidase)